ncbi:hypothetical protein LXL04_022346 [Taraxacum kok-saghyz]
MYPASSPNSRSHNSQLTRLTSIGHRRLVDYRSSPHRSRLRRPASASVNRHSPPAPAQASTSVDFALQLQNDSRFPAQDYSFLYMGRLLEGFGVGVISYTVPVYIAEIAPQNMRGSLGSVNQAKMGFIEDCETSLLVLRGFDSDISSEFNEIKRSMANSGKRATIRFSELKRRRYWYPLMVGIGLLLLQQLSGINGVLFYSSDIFESTVNFIVNGNSIEQSCNIWTWGSSGCCYCSYNRLGGQKWSKSSFNVIFDSNGCKQPSCFNEFSFEGKESSDRECGYYVMNSMHEFVFFRPHNFPNNICKDTRPFSNVQLDERVNTWMKTFGEKYLK